MIGNGAKERERGESSLKGKQRSSLDDERIRWNTIRRSGSCELASWRDAFYRWFALERRVLSAADAEQRHSVEFLQFDLNLVIAKFAEFTELEIITTPRVTGKKRDGGSIFFLFLLLQRNRKNEKKKKKSLPHRYEIGWPSLTRDPVKVRINGEVIANCLNGNWKKRVSSRKANRVINILRFSAKMEVSWMVEANAASAI